MNWFLNAKQLQKNAQFLQCWQYPHQPTAKSLFGKTYFYRCFDEHSEEPFVCTDNESNIGVQVEETVKVNLDRTITFQLKNPCPEHWPPDLLIHRLYLAFLELNFQLSSS